MILLNELQVAKIQAHLASAGIPDDLSTELLDHLCCAVEHRMQHGSSFEEAMAETLRSWPLRQLKDLHHSITYTTKTKPMIIRLSAAAALLAGLAFLSPLPWPEAAKAPLAYAPAPLHLDALPPVNFVFDPPTASPIAGVEMKDILSSGFGMRMHPLLKKKMHHRGIDLKAKTGTPVLATAAGKVVFAGDHGKHGIAVRIRHEDGYVTFYSHMSKFDVAQGDRVLLGQQVGAVGSTGAATAPHLHYEVLKDDTPVDPLALRD